MTTPFATFANATITFKISSGNQSAGQFGYTETNLIDYPVTCYLKQKRQPLAEIFEASNQQEIYVEGKCIDPKTLSPDIRPEVIVDAVVNGKAYKFRLEPTLPSPFYAENDILGQRLRGFLIETTVYGGSPSG